MANEIERQLGDSIDYAASWTIGDKPQDAAFGLALGTRTILLRSRYWQPSTLDIRPNFICDSLADACKIILNQSVPELAIGHFDP